MSSWWIYLDLWVLQDGNYPEFRTGDRRQFALEFFYNRSRPLRPPHEATHYECRNLAPDALYEITGQVVHVTPEEEEEADDYPVRDIHVIDFGLRAYMAGMLTNKHVPPLNGEWLTGEISLSVDHYPYKEYLGKRPGMPPLIYTWSIDEIQVSHFKSNTWRTIDQTRCWEDAGSYRLKCTLLDEEASNSIPDTDSPTISL